MRGSILATMIAAIAMAFSIYERWEGSSSEFFSRGALYFVGVALVCRAIETRERNRI